MIDLNLLKSLLRQDAYAKLTDAEAAALASTPILTARKGKATFTSLGDLWGLARAATFRATLKALASNADATIAATADYALGVLSGDGFDPGHPEAAKAGAVFVQLGAATAEEIQDSQYTVSYAAGDVASEKDVAEARRQNSVEADYFDRVTRNAAKWNAYVAALDVWRAGGFVGDAPADM